MSYFLEFIINPAISAFFTVVGGALPFALLLFVYSMIQKRKLLEFVPHQKDYLEKTNTQKEIAQGQINQFEDQIGNVGDIIADGSISEEEKKARIEFYSSLRDSLLRLELSAIETESFISYAEKYNFWTVIEDLLRKKHVGRGFFDRKNRD